MMENMVKCQFCKMVFQNVDEIQVHQLNCMGIEGDAGEIGTCDGISMNVNQYKTEEVRTFDEVGDNVQVLDYKLNKKTALAKKLKGCDKVKYDPVMHANCCVLTFSTAAFEVFRKEIVRYLDRKPEYVVKVSVQRDQGNSIPQDTIMVRVKVEGKKFEDSPPMYTINLYRTTGRVMVNGPFFRTFANQDLPVMENFIIHAEDLINEGNARIKEYITSIEKNEEVASCSEIHTHSSDPEKVDETGKRTRKKKTYHDFEVNVKKTRSSVLGNGKASSTEKLSKIDEERNWLVKPKFWAQYGYGEWTNDIAKECNKRKGCLEKCGRNNSSDMVRCDGCGRWCHFKCMGEKLLKDGEDFICGICQLKVQDKLVIEDCDQVCEQNSNDMNHESTESEGPNIHQLDSNNDSTSVQQCSDNIKSVVHRQSIDQFNFNVFINDMIAWYEKDKAAQKIISEPTLQYRGLSDGQSISFGVVCGPEKMVANIGGEEKRYLVSGDLQGVEKSADINANTLKIIKGEENADLFAMIYKQKNKIMELKSSNSTNCSISLPMAVLKQLNLLTQAIEKKEKENSELVIKNKQYSVDISEVKRSRKVYMEENMELKKNIKNKSEEVSQLNKQCAALKLEIQENNSKSTQTIEQLNNKCMDLQKELDKAHATSTVLQEKVAVLKAAAGDVLGSTSVEVVLTNDAKNKNLVDELDDIRKKYHDLVKDNTVLNDSINEIETKYARLDNYYKDIVEKKDKVISAYTEVTDSDNLDAKFRRLLMNYKAEKELISITQLKESLLADDEGIMEHNEENNDEETVTNNDNPAPIPNSRSQDPKLLQFVKNQSALHHNCAGTHNESGMEESYAGKARESSVDGDMPRRNGKKLCWFGKLCFRGDKCTFVHGEIANPPKCRFDLRCHKDECVFKHSNDCRQRVGCMQQGCMSRHVQHKRNNSTENTHLSFEERNNTCLSSAGSYTPTYGHGNYAQSSDVSGSKYMYPVKNRNYIQSAIQNELQYPPNNFLLGFSDQDSSNRTYYSNNTTHQSHISSVNSKNMMGR